MRRLAVLGLLLAHGAAGFGITGNRPRGLLMPANVCSLCFSISAQHIAAHINASTVIKTNKETNTRLTRRLTPRISHPWLAAARAVFESGQAR